MRYVLDAILVLLCVCISVSVVNANDEISVLNTESIIFNYNTVQEYDSWQIPLMIKVEESYGFPYVPTLQFSLDKGVWFDLDHYEGRIKNGSYLCVWYSDIISQLGAQYEEYLGKEFSFRIIWSAYGYPEHHA